jgi:uncharacterized Tic20 family protein
MNDPLDSAIPVGSGPGTTVPPSPTPPPAPPPRTAPPLSPPRGSDKVWAILCHVSGFISMPILLPLVVYLAMKDDSPYVRDNAKEALNFHISLFIYGVCLIPLIWLLIGIPLMIALFIGGLVLSIIAAIKASEGGVYQYPLTLRLVK